MRAALIEWRRPCRRARPNPPPGPRFSTAHGRVLFFHPSPFTLRPYLSALSSSRCLPCVRARVVVRPENCVPES